MKTRNFIIFIAILFNSLNSQSQEKIFEKKYFLLDLDSLNKEYKLNHVELNTSKIYGINQNVELFNLLTPKGQLILFSVLPPKVNALKIWKETDIDAIYGSILNWKTLEAIKEKAIVSFSDSGKALYENLKRHDIYLIKKEGGKYFIAENCILEFFRVERIANMFPNQSDIMSININTPTFSIKDFENEYLKLYKSPSPNSNFTGSISFLKYPFNKPLLFLSKVSNFGNKKMYHFWGFMDWSVHDGPNSQRGIDRFIYLPEVGIIGGSFDFYFKSLLNKNQQDENYLNEIIMYPSKINHISVRNVDPIKTRSLK